MNVLITIALCDDDAAMLAALAQEVQLFFDQKNIAANLLFFPDGKTLLSSEQQPDILFLDIQMEGLNGIETAQKLRRQGFDGFLIFVTILPEYVFNAFEVQPFDYLLKPLQKENFKQTLNRLLKTMRDKNHPCLLVQRGTERHIVPFSHIVYGEIIDRKIYLHLKDGVILDYYDRLEDLINLLDDRFFRCHRSYLLNLQYLKSYKAGEAYLLNGEAVPISRLREKAFSSAVIHYLKQERGEQHDDI